METQVMLGAGRLSYFVVLCNGTKVEAQRMKEELGGILRKMELTLSEEKTKITHITEGLDHGIGHFTSMSLQQTPRLDIAQG